MMSIRLIVTDLDDCAAFPGVDAPREHRRAVLKLAGLGDQSRRGEIPTIMVCTGRDRNSVERAIWDLGIGDKGALIESGLAFFKLGVKKPKPNPELSNFTQFWRALNIRIPPILQEHEELYQYPGKLAMMTIEPESYAGHDVDWYWRLFRERLSDLDFDQQEEGEPDEQRAQRILVVQKSQIAIDIMPVGKRGPLDKASGIRFLAQETGIPAKDMLSIGDSRGDLPMLRATGFVACPDNATTEVKRFIAEKGGYPSPYKYANGVVDIIEHFRGQNIFVPNNKRLVIGVPRRIQRLVRS